jgi:hypothetical protein
MKQSLLLSCAMTLMSASMGVAVHLQSREPATHQRSRQQQGAQQ